MEASETMEELEARVSEAWFALVAAERADVDVATLTRLCRAYLDAASELSLARTYVELQQTA